MAQAPPDPAFKLGFALAAQQDGVRDALVRRIVCRMVNNMMATMTDSIGPASVAARSGLSRVPCPEVRVSSPRQPATCRYGLLRAPGAAEGQRALDVVAPTADATLAAPVPPSIVVKRLTPGLFGFRLGIRQGRPVCRRRFPRRSGVPGTNAQVEIAGAMHFLRLGRELV